jgi:hypothetical protein
VASSPPAVGAPAIPSGWRRYRVRGGDTLGRIADCRGVALETLAKANAIADPDRLLAGTRLYVPPRDRCAARSVTAAGAPGAAAVARAPSAAPDPSPASALEGARRLLAAARSRYDEADFAEALLGAEAASQKLAPTAGEPRADALRARAHLLAGMSAAGLEQRERAIEEFRQAFALDPALACPPEDCSPRILELVQAARPLATGAPAP